MPGFGVLPHHAVYERYVDGLMENVAASPLLIPAVGGRHRQDADAYAADCVALLDGLVFPGGSSHVAPELYGDTSGPDSGERDSERDSTTLPLIRAALAAGVPILAICRGMQELNVALGGTLEQRVHDLPGRRDHRSRKDVPFAERYHPAHPLRLASDSWMERTLRARGVPTDDLTVNSLHNQAVASLGEGVVAEAWADDGTIEAIRVDGCPALALGLQWHVEWHTDSPLYAALWHAFGQACEGRAAARRDRGGR